MLNYLKLEVLRMLRNRRYLWVGLAVPLGFYILYGAILGSSWQVAGMNFSVYYMVSMAAFGAMGVGFNTGGSRLAAERASGWTTQLRLTPLPPRAYVVTKILTAMAVALPAIVLIEVAGAVINHVSLPATTWLAITLLLWVGSLPFGALGVLIGYLFDSDSAHIGTLGVYFTLAMLGGMWMPLQAMPHALQEFARALPSYRYAQMGWLALGGHGPGLSNVAVLVGYLAVFGALVAWRYRHEAAHTA